MIIEFKKSIRVEHGDGSHKEYQDGHRLDTKAINAGTLDSLLKTKAAVAVAETPPAPPKK